MAVQHSRRSSRHGSLRARAEALVRQSPRPVAKASTAGLKRLVQELQIHQVELQMQNEELREAQLELSRSRVRLNELYDFAPVGYVTVDARDKMREVNLTACQMLGVARTILIGRTLAQFMDRKSADAFYRHCREVLAGHEAAPCEVFLHPTNGAPLVVEVRSIRFQEGSNSDPLCQTSLVDITERKRQEAELKQLNAHLEDRVADRTAKITELAEQLRQQLQARVQAEAAHKALARQLAEAQDAERARLSRDIHDQCGQELTSLRLHLDALSASRELAPSLRQLAKDIVALAERLMRSLHRLAWELRPSVLGDLGLDKTLQYYGEQWSQQSGVALTYSSRGLGESRLAPLLEATVYRIAQQALSNVAKHAAARQVRLEVQRRDKTVNLAVKDDGCGFDGAKAFEAGAQRGRLGLLGMRDRAELLGGRLIIESRPGQGTTLRAILPVDQTPETEAPAEGGRMAAPKRAKAKN